STICQMNRAPLLSTRAAAIAPALRATRRASTPEIGVALVSALMESSKEPHPPRTPDSNYVPGWGQGFAAYSGDTALTTGSLLPWRGQTTTGRMEGSFTAAQSRTQRTIMNILMFSMTPLFPDRAMGGAQKQLKRIALHLGELGHDVTLLATRRSDSLTPFQWSERVRVLPIFRFKQPYPEPYATPVYNIAAAIQDLG